MPSFGALAILIIAAFADTFFLTGYIFYGSLVATSATAALVAGVDPILVGVASFLGCMLGEAANITASKTSDSWREKLDKRAKRRLDARRPQEDSEENGSSTWFSGVLSILRFVVAPVTHVQSETWYSTALKVTGRRFLASSRPLNAHFLVQVHSLRRSFAALAFSSAVWVIFWLYIFDNVADFLGSQF